MSASKGKVKFTAMTIIEAEKEDDTRLFVLNRTKEAANINMNIHMVGGETALVTIPFSPCPLDLSNYAPKSDLLRTPMFRRMIASGIVAVIDTAEAYKFITEDPRGQRETRRMLSENEIGNAALQSVVESEFREKDDKRELAEQLGVEAPSIFIESMVLRAATETAGDLISELEARINVLTEEELQYLADNCASSELKEWVLSVI